MLTLPAPPKYKRPADNPRGDENGAGKGFGAFCPGGSGGGPEQPRSKERGDARIVWLSFLTWSVYHKAHQETRDNLRKFC